MRGVHGLGPGNNKSVNNDDKIDYTQGYRGRGRSGGISLRGREGGYSKVLLQRGLVADVGRLVAVKEVTQSSSLLTKSCYKCAKLGHFARDCLSSNSELICFNCSLPGHYAKDCQIKQNQERKGKFCDYCKKSGHVIDDCRILAQRVEENKKEKNISLNE